MDLPHFVHVPGTMPVPKMDTPLGMFAGTCSCGWQSEGLGSRVQALRNATQHAEMKNERVVRPDVN